MSQGTASKWLMVCLYYDGPWEEFLARAVKPYIGVVLQAGIAERFYFRRSQDRDSAIGLYFKGNPYVLEKMLRPNLEEHFIHYFESRPAVIGELPCAGGFSPGFRWLAGYSMRCFDSNSGLPQPDSSPDLLLCCERQFQASSLIIMKILKEKLSVWGSDEMLSTAFKLHLSFAYAVGMGIDEARQFFQQMSAEWLRRWEETKATGGKSQSREAALLYFQKNYESQKKDITSYLAALWELFKNYRKVEDKTFVDWMHVNTDISLELNLALESGKHRLYNGHRAAASHQPALYSLYSEFIRQTSNRLDIHPKTEGYLYFVLSRSLQAVKPGVLSLTKISA